MITNTIEKILTYDNHWKPENSTFSASQLAGSSDYQLWLAYQKTPKTYVQPLENKVNSALGTGFHLLAEQALQDEPDTLLEAQFARIVDGEWITGSCDVIRENTEYGVIFEDHKTKGVYQAKKALQGDLEDVKIQLSIYRYLYWLGNPSAKFADFGLVNMIVTGDQGYMSKADGGGKVPKFEQLKVTLWSIEKTEKFIKSKIEVAKQEEQFCDCDAWRCGYCEFECLHRK